MAIARTGAESITDLLGEIKSKIVAAQDPSADQAKLQTDIAELRNQVGSVENAAQFNGLNLVDGTNASVNVLASLDRDSTGAVTASNITVSGQNLSISAGAVKAAFAGSDGVGGDAATAAIFIDAWGTADIVVVDAALAAGDTVAMTSQIVTVGKGGLSGINVDDGAGGNSLKTGIGALVDADMEEASARLQALQVQQQLATQSLSIAN